jgi:hypothetical protein
MSSGEEIPRQITRYRFSETTGFRTS